jgi:hypothetical protein
MNREHEIAQQMKLELRIAASLVRPINIQTLSGGLPLPDLARDG